MFSFLYRWTRLILKIIVDCVQRFMRVSRDFEMVIKIGERLIKMLLLPGIRNIITVTIPKRTVSIGNVMFGNPVTFASFQGDYNQIELWLRLGLGGGCFKTITIKPRLGNERPRYQDICYQGQPALINALGLPGPGVDKFLNEIKAINLFRYGRPLGISIGGHRAENYRIMFDKVVSFVAAHSLENQCYVELNISCPNTPSQSDLSQHMDQLQSLLEEMRQKSNILIGVKVSPDQNNSALLVISQIIKSVSNTYINLGNTHYKRCEDVGLFSTDLSIGGGGLSGPSLYSRTLELVELVAPIGLPIIATGGISSVDQVRDVLNAGATLVGVATALVRDPFSVSEWGCHL